VTSNIQYKKLVHILLLMKTFISFGIPTILAISLVLLLNPMTSSQTSYGQANQTGGQNTTQQSQQQVQQANQTQQQSNQSKQQDPQMIEKLLNYTNAAIIALNEDNTSAAQGSLVQIQNTLINASGKQVLVIPAPAISVPSDDDNGDSD
jgi:polyphosphate kinase 2 (PPK2 family)